MLLVGLTGGIGAGKSTVAELLAARGAVIVDADRVARAVVEPGQPALKKLVERFGESILDPDGRLERGALAKLVFGDDEARRDLEAITHPAINDEFSRRVVEAPSDAVVVLAAGTWTPDAIASGYERVQALTADMDDGRRRRLARLGFPADEAAELSALHTRNFM